MDSIPHFKIEGQRIVLNQKMEGFSEKISKGIKLDNSVRNSVLSIFFPKSESINIKIDNDTVTVNKRSLNKWVKECVNEGLLEKDVNKLNLKDIVISVQQKLNDIKNKPQETLPEQKAVNIDRAEEQKDSEASPPTDEPIKPIQTGTTDTKIKANEEISLPESNNIKINNFFESLRIKQPTYTQKAKEGLSELQNTMIKISSKEEILEEDVTTITDILKKLSELTPPVYLPANFRNVYKLIFKRVKLELNETNIATLENSMEYLTNKKVSADFIPKAKQRKYLLMSNRKSLTKSIENCNNLLKQIKISKSSQTPDQHKIFEKRLENIKTKLESIKRNKFSSTPPPSVSTDLTPEIKPAKKKKEVKFNEHVTELKFIKEDPPRTIKTRESNEISLTESVEQGVHRKKVSKIKGRPSPLPDFYWPGKVEQ